MSSLRLKLLLRRLSVSAPTMKIKTQVPWPLRMIFLAAVLGLSWAIAMWFFELGRSLTGFNPAATKEKLTTYREKIEELQAERDELSSKVNAAGSQLNIERAAQNQLVTQVKTLETENIKLKENLAFFESLLPTDTGPAGISIRRLKVETVSPNQLKYRLLLMQGGRGDHEFSGNLQLIVTAVQDGKSAMMSFPNSGSGDADKYALNFKHYQRVEGVLTLPDGVKAKSVQAKIVANGQVRAQQSANL